MSSRQIRIARIAKVSQSTVSRALHNHPALPKSTCLRIQAIARRLSYAQNPLVSSIFADLRRGPGGKQLGALAFLTAHETRDSWRQVATFRDFYLGARQRAEEQGFSLEEHWAAEPGMTAPRLTGILNARGINGVIVSTRSPTEKSPEIAWDHFAVVRIGLAEKQLPCHYAINDQVGTARLVAERLTDRGCTRIGLALSRWQSEVTDRNWLAGFLSWQHMQPLRHRTTVHLPEDLHPENVIHWAKSERLDGIIAVNPDVLPWLQAAGLRVPEKVAFALLDWHDHYGAIAGADQNNLLVGAAAVDILLSQMRRNERGLPANPRSTLIKSSWRDGATVA
jgi:DNA-binding LacI/PurR family transcriptional regulator